MGCCIPSKYVSKSSLHADAYGRQLSALTWLDLPAQQNRHRMSRTDAEKRLQLLAELIYYLFDSFLIPLISKNFYVTETAVHRNQLCYFRHDVWRKLSEPALSSLTTTTFEALDPPTYQRLLAHRNLSTSRVRFLPKETGLRPIVNLRRRVATMVGGKLKLGKSVNSVMNPVFNVLNYEKVSDRGPKPILC